MTTERRERLMYAALYGVVLLLGAAWAVQHLRGSYFFYDEWSIVGHILHRSAPSLVFQEHNGHLWVLASLMYRIQLNGWGVQSHWFINLMLVGSLVALHAALTRLLRVLSLAPTTAVLLAGALTYLGLAGQNIVFAVQFSLALSLALGAALVGTVMRGAATPRARVLIAVLAAASVLVENGGSLVLLPMATVLLFGLRDVWGRRSVLLVVPAWAVAALWHVVAPEGPTFDASWGRRAWFALHLLLVSAGSLVGRTGTAGIVVIAVMVGVVFVSWRQGWLDARAKWLVAGAIASLAAVIGAITMARAGLPNIADFQDYNRYLQCVALPLAIASVAPITACWRHRPVRWGLRSRVSLAVAPAFAVAMFVVGMAPLRWYDQRFDVWNAMTRREVHDAAVVLRDGCPSGAAPDLTSRPLRDLAPMLPAYEIADLIDQGYLDVPSDELINDDPDTGVLGPLCPVG